MSTFSIIAGGRVRDPLWRGTAIAGAGVLAGCGLALAGDARIGLGLAGAGTVVAAFALAPAAVALRPVAVLGVLGCASLVAWVLFGMLGFGFGVDALPGLSVLGAIWSLGPATLAVAALAALGGVVLIADALRPQFAGGGRATWRDVTSAGRVGVGGLPWRAVGGVLLIAFAGLLLFWLAWPSIGSNPGWQFVLLLLILAVFAVVIGAPFAVAAVARADRTRVTAINDSERRRVAAHLHDSVLQTLALVQRQAEDPVAVARLARRQEQSLRAWLAGQDEPVGGTLVGALHDAVATVEEESPPLHVDVVAAGDRALDGAAEALVAATREVLRNAGRHAPGAGVHVFAQADARGAEVFVRDEGPGFDQHAVPDARRGLRDAVIGRMAATGGSAVVDSRPGEGTEVTLRIGPPA